MPPFPAEETLYDNMMMMIIIIVDFVVYLTIKTITLTDTAVSFLMRTQRVESGVRDLRDRYTRRDKEVSHKILYIKIVFTSLSCLIDFKYRN